MAYETILSPVILAAFLAVYTKTILMNLMIAIIKEPRAREPIWLI